LATCPLLSAR